jgi:hypothetical protein
LYIVGPTHGTGGRFRLRSGRVLVSWRVAVGLRSDGYREPVAPGTADSPADKQKRLVEIDAVLLDPIERVGVSVSAAAVTMEPKPLTFVDDAAKGTLLPTVVLRKIRGQSSRPFLAAA